MNTIPFDYTWARPSKKSISCGVYLPSMLKEGLDIALHIDTSASIGVDDLRDSLSEIVGIKRSFSGVTLTVIICDCEIHEVVELNDYSDIDELLVKIKGGGGTSHVPVYDWIEENKPNTKLLISFTDGYTEFPKKDKEYIKTIWVMPTTSGDIKVPFGETLFYEKGKGGKK
jgi:predicted metal-dependent peptidase